MNLFSPILFSVFVMALSLLEVQPSPGSNWRPVSANQEARADCGQLAAERGTILLKAQNEKYSLRRIEFIGNAKTRDLTLRRRIILQEGNVFSRALLIKSLRSVSKVRTIWPVRLNDVAVNLNNHEKTIDVAICFREKKRLAE
jgi:hypothetical protein